MSDPISFDGFVPICNLRVEQLTEDRLLGDYLCRTCGYTKDEHRRK
jgi:hypothetical protein